MRWGCRSVFDPSFRDSDLEIHQADQAGSGLRCEFDEPRVWRPYLERFFFLACGCLETVSPSYPLQKQAFVP